MKRTHFKLRSWSEGSHIKTTVFSGKEGETLANTGTLTQSIGEWQLFGALLKLGSEVQAAAIRATVTFEGDDIIAKEVSR